MTEKLPKNKPALVALFTTHLHELPAASKDAEAAPPAAASADSKDSGKDADAAGAKAAAPPRPARRVADESAAVGASAGMDVGKMKVRGPLAHLRHHFNGRSDVV